MKFIKASLLFPVGSSLKNLPAKVGGMGSIPGWRRSLGEGNDNPLQSSCLENPMDRGTWQAIVHGVAKESDVTWLLNNNKDYNLATDTNNPMLLLRVDFGHLNSSIGEKKNPSLISSQGARNSLLTLKQKM